MTQNEKDLLLKELCTRLPYGVKVLCLRDFNHEWYNLEKVDIGDNELYVTTYESYENKYVKVEDALPYLFPLSSMTDEQKKEDYEICKGYIIGYESKLIDFYNKNHIDYRGLIDKGLAIDATNLNIY